MGAEHQMSHHRTEADARIAIVHLLRRAKWDPLDKSHVGTEVQATAMPVGGDIVDRSQARPFETHAPVYDVVAAARAFGATRVLRTSADELGWILVAGRVP